MNYVVKNETVVDISCFCTINSYSHIVASPEVEQVCHTHTHTHTHTHILNLYTQLY